MSDNDGYLEIHSESMDDLKEAIYMLRVMADAHYDLGNDAQATKLFTAIRFIAQGMKKSDESFNMLFNTWTRDVQQSTTNMMQAALNVALYADTKEAENDRS